MLKSSLCRTESPQQSTCCQMALWHHVMLLGAVNTFAPSSGVTGFWTNVGTFSKRVNLFTHKFKKVSSRQNSLNADFPFASFSWSPDNKVAAACLDPFCSTWTCFLSARFSISTKYLIIALQTENTHIYLTLSPNDFSPVDSLCFVFMPWKSEWLNAANVFQLNKDETDKIPCGCKDGRQKLGGI